MRKERLTGHFAIISNLRGDELFSLMLRKIAGRKDFIHELSVKAMGNGRIEYGSEDV